MLRKQDNGNVSEVAVRSSVNEAVVVKSAEASITVDKDISLFGSNALYMWLLAKHQVAAMGNLVLTFKKVVDGTEYTTESITVAIPNGGAESAVRIDVDATGNIAEYDTVSITGTLTNNSNDAVVILLGKQTLL